jgi:hypothetical protein
MERISKRKSDRRRAGFYVDADQWSEFSALSGDLDDDFYEPTDGTCDGDSQHSRAFYFEAEDELEEERRYETFGGRVHFRIELRARKGGEF